MIEYVKLTYEITPKTKKEVLDVISEIESEMSMYPVSIGYKDKEYPITSEPELDSLLEKFF